MEETKKKEIKELCAQVNRLKMKLNATDYKAIKYAEGSLSIAEFAPIKAKRQTWRVEINQLEDKIQELRGEK